jgi:hypothetical protein
MRAIPFLAPEDPPPGRPLALLSAYLSGIPPTIREPLLAKLTVHLPVDQLGLASLQSRVVFAVIEDELDGIATDIARPAQVMEELENHVRSMASKEQNVQQTPTVVQAKSHFLNDWIEAATDKSRVMPGANMIEDWMRLFTFVTTVLHLLWTRNQREKRG